MMQAVSVKYEARGPRLWCEKCEDMFLAEGRRVKVKHSKQA